MVDDLAVGQGFLRAHRVFLLSIICLFSKMLGGAEVTWHSRALVKHCQMTFALTVILERLLWESLHRV
jgi:hypothetical protein